MYCPFKKAEMKVAKSSLPVFVLPLRNPWRSISLIQNPAFDLKTKEALGRKRVKNERTTEDETTGGY
jgi:hypothetical protein